MGDATTSFGWWLNIFTSAALGASISLNAGREQQVERRWSLCKWASRPQEAEVKHDFLCVRGADQSLTLLQLLRVSYDTMTALTKGMSEINVERKCRSHHNTLVHVQVAYERKQEDGLHYSTWELQTPSAEGSAPLQYHLHRITSAKCTTYSFFSLITILSGDHL